MRFLRAFARPPARPALAAMACLRSAVSRSALTRPPLLPILRMWSRNSSEMPLLAMLPPWNGSPLLDGHARRVQVGRSNRLSRVAPPEDWARMGGAQFEAPESPLPFTGQWRTRSALTAAASAVRAPVAATWGRAKEAILYGKIFASMWDGTIATKWPVWSTFVYMIANCDGDGVIEKTPEAIAAASGIPLDEVIRAIAHLEAPDARSRTREHEGRRIERLDPSRDWGWVILNYKKYRGLRDTETRKEQNREAQRRRRGRQQESAAVSHCQPRSAQEEVEVEAVDSKHLRSDERSAPASPSLNGNGSPRRKHPEAEHPEFPAFYAAFPRHRSRRTASRAFNAALKRHPDVLDPDDLTNAARAFATLCQTEGRSEQHVPYPATWLNSDDFLELFEETRTRRPDEINGHE